MPSLPSALETCVFTWLLGRITIARLSDRMPDVYSRIRYGRIFRDNDSSILASIENATLRGEQQMREQRQKEREQKMAASANRT